MSSYHGADLFRSGPHRFSFDGVALRHALHESPGIPGVRVSPQGVGARIIHQSGTLTADTLEQLDTLKRAIESHLDGIGHDLLDDHGRLHNDVVMLRFTPAADRRLGPRWACEYRIEYLQVNP
jgi:hypothetical protein